MDRISRTSVILSLVVGLSGILVSPVHAQAEDPYAYGDDYASGDLGRVTYQENGVTIRRAVVDPGLPASEIASVNAPVFPGDILLTANDQRGEVQLAGGSLIRIDVLTDLTFLSLPDPYAEFADSTVLQLAEGTIRITTNLQEGEEFRVDTPTSSVYFLGDGDFRIEVTPGGRTEVVSRRGVAEVVGNGGSVLVHGGTRTEVFAGSLPEEPWAFNTFVADTFDQWVDERDSVYHVRQRYPGQTEYSTETYEALPDEVRPYYHELNYHGAWTYVADYGYVWYPTAVAADWHPYYDGYWSYGPGGYFWVSYEPWGWAPYHYGSWSWVVGYGWCWAPGRVFGGAWVAWSWGSAYVGWAPLDYWGRPAYVRGVYFGYYDPTVWTFVDYAYVDRRNYQRYAVRVGEVGDDLRHATVVTRAPRVSPRLLARAPDTRDMAVRIARQDRGARMRAVRSDAEPTVSMRDVGRELRARTPAARSGRARGADRAQAPAARRRQASSAGAPDAERSSRARSSGVERGGSAQRSGRGAFPSYPRRISSGSGAQRAPARRSTVTTPRTDPETQRRTTLPRVRSRDTGRANTEQRVRDLYRRMANPRSTEERGSTETRRVQPDRRSEASRDSRAGSRRPSPRARPSERQPTRSRAPAPRKREESRAPAKRSEKPRQSGSSAKSERRRDDSGSPSARSNRSNSLRRPSPTRSRSGVDQRRSTSVEHMRNDTRTPTRRPSLSRTQRAPNRTSTTRSNTRSAPSRPSANRARPSGGNSRARAGSSAPSQRPAASSRSGSRGSRPSSGSSRAESNRGSNRRGNKR